MPTHLDQLTARDVMQRDVITVNPETSILDVHRLFVEEEIHGAPVVGEDGIVYGVISTIDLLRIVRDELERGTIERAIASDAMTKEIVMVSPDMPLAEVACTMLSQRIHRVLVGSNRELEGVLTTFDVLRPVAEEGEPHQQRHTGYAR